MRVNISCFHATLVESVTSTCTMYMYIHIKFNAGSSGGRVVKLLACGARGPGFDSRPRHLNFQRLVISCFQVEIWLKGSGGFQICYSNRDHGSLESVMVSGGLYGDLIKQYEVSLSRMLNYILKLTKRSDYTNFMTLIPTLTFIKFRKVSIAHLKRLKLQACQQSTLTLLNLSLLGTCTCFCCWDHCFHLIWRDFLDLFTSNVPQCFLDFAWQNECATTVELISNSFKKE